MSTVRVYRRNTWLLCVRRSTARAAESASGVQRPQQQRADGKCAELALRAHQAARTVRASLEPTAFLRVRRRRVGSVGSAPSARLVGGCMSGASSWGGAAAGLLRCSQRGPRAHHVTKKYSRGIPSHGVRCAGTGGAHGCCGCGVAPPSGRVRSGCAATSATTR
jgi:hypothetical protein